jgi:hypothetical protein
MLQRLLRLLVALLLGLAQPLSQASWTLPSAARIAAIAAAGIATSGRALAQYQSGGYSRPSSGGYSAPRRPSVSSGSYSQPYAAPSNRAYSGFGGDQAISRRSSADALSQYRQSQQPPALPQERRPATGSGEGSLWGYEQRRPSNGIWGSTSGYGPGYGPAGPSYSWAQPNRSFGIWDGLLLYGLLSSLSQPGRANFFYSNQDDPGYREWRAEADRTAQQDPALKAKLAELDKRVAELQGQPKTPGQVPPDVTKRASPEHSGGSMVWIFLLLAIGLFVLLWLWRRRMAQAAGMPGVSTALHGSAQTRFRVGMTVPVDPTPFVLAGSATKVRGIDGSGTISIEAVGVLMDGSIALNRLYLPGRQSFFQLHLGRDGNPDECRYFSQVDEVTPGSREEWGAWLDPAEGMIGWPQFQTKDGKLYGRAWAAGANRIPPREMTETVQDLNGTATRKLMAMLYAAPTGAAAPAPSTEYILVSAVEATGQASVAIHAGIDINPAALTLPAVALT